MKEKLQQFLRQGWVAHLLRAQKRFGNRLGDQFAGAITYFSVLAIVPILMIGFSVLGLTLTVVRPDLLSSVQETIREQFGGQSAGESLAEVMENALKSWGTVGILGFGSLVYAGSGWVGNLKQAVRAQWTPTMEGVQNKRFIVLEIAVNIAILFGLLFFVALVGSAATVGTALNSMVIDALGLAGVPGIGWWTWLVLTASSVFASWLMFLYLYRVLPQQKVPFSALAKGAFIAAIGFVVLQNLTGLLMGAFAGNPAAALFGPVITLMLFFNIFARLTLLVAAWIATTNQPAIAFEHNDCDDPLRERADVIAADGHWVVAEQHRKETEESAGDEAPADRPDAATTAWVRQRREAPGPLPAGDDPTKVPTEVAAQGVRAGMRTGYVVGAATGVGLGAVIATLTKRLTRR